MDIYEHVIITGASKGFGRSIAIAFAEQEQMLEKNLQFTLCGRNECGLREVEDVITDRRRALRRKAATASCAGKTKISLVIEDLAGLDNLEQAAAQLFATAEFSVDGVDHIAAVCSRVIFINNAGSLGPLCEVGSPHMTLSELTSAVNLNVTSCVFLTSEFVKRVKNGSFSCSSVGAQQHEGKHKFTTTAAVVVNVSSLCAVKAFPSWSVYCAGKAARDMFHSNLALEQQQQQQQQQDGQQAAPSGSSTSNSIGSRESSSCSVSVLNYAPGPLDTAMQTEVRESTTVNSATRNTFCAMKSAGQLVSPDASAKKLVNLLHLGLYENGAHVDYYDEIEPI